MDEAKLCEAAERGMSSAGFVNVKGCVESDDSRLMLTVRGDCPCGLGQSGLGMAFSRHSFAHSNVDADALIERVEQQIHWQAMKHIEDDRAEGRWV